MLSGDTSAVDVAGALVAAKDAAGGGSTRGGRGGGATGDDTRPPGRGRMIVCSASAGSANGSSVIRSLSSLAAQRARRSALTWLFQQA